MASYRDLCFIETEIGKMAQGRFFSPSGLSSCLSLNLCSESWKFFPFSFWRACEKSNGNERLRERRRDREGGREEERKERKQSEGWKEGLAKAQREGRRTRKGLERKAGWRLAAEPTAAPMCPWDTPTRPIVRSWLGLWLQKVDAPRSKLMTVCSQSLPFYVQGKSE